MSQENVEIVRQTFAAFGDRVVDAWLVLRPGREWLPFRAQLEGCFTAGMPGSASSLATWTRTGSVSSRPGRVSRP